MTISPSKIASLFSSKLPSFLKFWSHVQAAANMEVANTTANTPQLRALNFRIPDRLLETLTKRRALKKMAPVYWDYDWYENAVGQKVRVSYSNNIEDSEILAQRFIGEPVVGFDMEWKSFSVGGQITTTKDNLSLIQVARDGEVGLFHIAQHRGSKPSELFAPSLVKLIRNPNILKTGVSVYQSDGKRLKMYANIEGRGFFELNRLHGQLVGPSAKGGMVGLATQVETHLGFPLAKGLIRTGNWAAPLNAYQVKYAAADAYAGLVLFHTMNEKRLQLNPVPELPGFAEPLHYPNLTPPSSVRRADKIVGRQHPIVQAVLGKPSKLPHKVVDNQNENDASEESAFETGDDEPITIKQRPRFRMPPPLHSVPGPEFEPMLRIPLQDLPLPLPSNNNSGQKRKRGLASSNDALTTKRSREDSTIHWQSNHADVQPHAELATALQALRHRLVLSEPSSAHMAHLAQVTEQTFDKMAASRPSSVADLCRIPGGVPFMRYCSANKVELLAFVKEHGAT